MAESLETHSWGLAAGGFGLWALVAAILARIDRRRLDGENTWSKPFKFASSLSIHFATFAIIVRFLPMAQRLDVALVWSLIASLGAALFAQSYITIQAGRRRRSHFNTTTRVESAALAITGLCAVVVLAPAIVVGFDAIMVSLPGWTGATRAGVAFGMLVGSLLTTTTGFQMGAAGSHFVGRPLNKPRLMRFTGWSLDTPDLRPAHFLANHMMQAAPLAGIVFTLALGRLPALALTVAFGCIWALFTLFASRLAMSRKPLPKAFAVLG